MTGLRNSRFWWEKSEISPNAMALTANVPKHRGEILEISHITIHETQFSAPSRANSEISQNVMALIANEPKQRGEILEIFHLIIHKT